MGVGVVGVVDDDDDDDDDHTRSSIGTRSSIAHEGCDDIDDDDHNDDDESDDADDGDRLMRDIVNHQQPHHRLNHCVIPMG